MNYIGYLSVLVCNLKSSLSGSAGLPPKYLVDVIFHPQSASSNRPLRSLNRLDLLVPHSRTALAQSRSFAPIGTTLWNALFPSVHLLFFSGSLSSSFAFFSHGALHTGTLLNGSPH